MRPGKQRLLLGVSALLLVVVGVLVLLGRSSDGTRAIPKVAPIDLQWREGSSQAYDLLVDSSFLMTMPGASSSQSMNLHLNGVLEFRTLEVGPRDVLVGMRFSAIEMQITGVSDDDVNRALTLPFRVRFASQGVPTAFEFPAALAADLREVIENLVRMFQVVTQEGDAWVVQESNAWGMYEAAYTRRSPSTIVKKKQRYLGSSQAGATTLPQVASSEESIRIDLKRDWIAAMTLDETIITKDLNGPSVEVTNHATLELRHAHTVAAADQWRFDTAVEPALAKKPAQAAEPALSQEEAERQVRAGITSLDDAVKGRIIGIHRLRDLILIDGQVPVVLLESMRTQQLTDRTRADLYLALELAGSPEAQAALTSVITDASWSPQDGMRAIVALGGVANPTQDTFAVLWDTALGGLMGDDRDDLPGTAALALGSLGRGMLAAEDANYSSLRADLLVGASSAGSSHQRAVFLTALGNTGDPDPSMRSDIVPFLDDPVPEVRSAAAKTLGRLGTSPVADELLQRFEQERSSEVRGSIAEALASWEDPSRPAIESARAVVRDEPDQKVRYNMALLLGRNMDQFPKNRLALEELLAVEQSKQIRQQVVEMLYEPR